MRSFYNFLGTGRNREESWFWSLGRDNDDDEIVKDEDPLALVDWEDEPEQESRNENNNTNDFIEVYDMFSNAIHAFVKEYHRRIWCQNCKRFGYIW